MTTIAKMIGMTGEQLGALTLLGLDLLEAGNLDGAGDVFRGVLALDPIDTRALAGFGLVLQRKNMTAEAESVYSQLIELNPTDFAALAARGDLRCRRGDLGGIADLKAAAVPSSPVSQQAGALLRRFT